MRTRSWTPVLAGVGAVFLLAACSGGSDGAVGLTATAVDETPALATDTATDAATTPTPEALASPASTGTPPGDTPANAAALDFTARRLSGGHIDGQQLAGGDVALWMWAPWCPQCNREAPHVARAAERFDGQVTFIGIAGHDADDAHRAFVAEHGLQGLVHLVDDDGSLWARYDVSYQPAWVFIDEDGGTQLVAGGLYDDLDDHLQALVDR